MFPPPLPICGFRRSESFAMMIGIRIILLAAIFVVLVPLLAYFITRNVSFYRFAMKSAKIVAALLAAIALIYLAERLILVV